MKWKIPPEIKIYEALGCIADDRIEINGNKVKTWSSSRNKYYEVEYEEQTRKIIANDNGSYYQKYLGYPMIAYLMKIDELSFDEKCAEMLKGIMWKDLNMKYNRNKGERVPDYDFDGVIEEIYTNLEEKRKDVEKLKKFVEKVLDEIKEEEFEILESNLKPPKEY